MSSRGAKKWLDWLTPQIGHRILGTSGWTGRHAPLAGWGYFAVLAFMTPRLVALAFVGLMPVLGFLLLGMESPAMYMVFAITTLILAALVVTWFARPNVSVQVDMPVRIAGGSSFRSRFTIHNTGRRAAVDLSVEALPYPNPLDIRFQPAGVPYVPAGQRCMVEGNVKARRRGRFRLQPFRWDSDFPMGLWRFGHTDWTARWLNVYPAYTPLTSLEIPQGIRNRLDTHPARQWSRAALEFHGCREFRTGDAMRHVHPRSSARLGVPVVKEFQAEGRARIALLVDTWRSIPIPRSDIFTDPVVESALSMAAAVAEALARSDRILELLVAGPGLYRFESAGQLGYFEEVLDILAAIEPCATDPLAELANTVLDEIREIQSVVLILGHWNPLRAELVQRLQDEEVGVKVILTQRRQRPRPNTLPPDAILTTCTAIRNGEITVI